MTFAGVRLLTCALASGRSAGCKFCAWLPRNAVFVNADAWSDLSDESKSVMNDCASTAAADGLQRSKDYTDFTLEELEKNGMTVLEGNSEFIAAAREATAPIIEDWIAKVGPKGEAIVSEFRKRTQD